MSPGVVARESLEPIDAIRNSVDSRWTLHLSCRGIMFMFRKNKNSEKTDARARNTPFGTWREALTCSLL
uniref:Uncharacterized protein n=1 Tax=Candidatus Kentrum sp. SD TaxID=2126332 RepID=A0A451BMV9_9GAMM|nr:MAG: hypothetical protein BECKSD772F_GA0070984_10179 [Candidatus Kentron sp. SD]VFK41278.1 MAG: hypothetical protein BECKSD772E_GA0070983_10114 [Candidatus Kentron sp. SD]VFK79598.1 MAG: hypothetical protein BECKSD772D_GA0070982_10569 [Candidatus Kentron sp. SD]